MVLFPNSDQKWEFHLHWSASQHFFDCRSNAFGAVVAADIVGACLGVVHDLFSPLVIEESSGFVGGSTVLEFVVFSPILERWESFLERVVTGTI